MGDKTIYLLYNTHATDIELHQAKTRGDAGGRLVWEYVDKDEFTITYGPSDERKYTDIKILSKTKLKQRPKSAETVIDQPKSSIEGILLRRTSSLCSIDEIILMRRSPIIKPLVSETVIARLQRLQEDCMRHQYERESKSMDGKSIKDIHPGTFTAEKGDVKENTTKTKTGNLLSLSPIDIKTKRKISSVGFRNDTKTGFGIDSKHKKESLKKDKPVKEKKAVGKLQPETIPSKAMKGTTATEKGKSKKMTRDYDEKENVKVAKDINKNLKSKSPVEQTVAYKRQKNITDDYKQEKSMKRKQRPSGVEDEMITTLQNKSKVAKNAQLEKDKDEIGKDTVKRKSALGDKEEKKEQRKKDKITKGKPTSMSEKSMKSDKSGKDAKSEKAVKEGKSVTSRKDEKSNKSDRKESGRTGSMTDKQENIVTSSKDKTKKASIKSAKLKDELEYQQSPKDKKLKSDLDPAEDRKTASGKPKSRSSKQLESTDPSRKRSRRSSVHLSFTLTKGKLKEDLARKRGRKPSSTTQYMIQYVLSNPIFIKLGWTLQTTDRALTRVVTFKVLPANPKIYSFREREEEETKYYSSGILAVQIGKDGTGVIYYPSGSPAMVTNRNDTGMRLTLYSDPKKDPLIKDSYRARVVGMFDSYGNGVVYDLQGKKILNYNQLEGIFNNPLRRTPYKWRWSGYETLEKQRLKELLNSMVKEEKYTPTVQGKKGATPPVAKKQLAEKKTAVDKEYEDLLAQLPYPVPPKRKLKNETNTSGFKSIILKINDEMTLRINGQDSTGVYFSSDKVFYRHDLGVIVDPETVERIEDLSPDKLCDVPCVFEALLNLSPSLQRLNKQQQPEPNGGYRKKSDPHRKHSSRPIRT